MMLALCLFTEQFLLFNSYTIIPTSNDARALFVYRIIFSI